MDLASGRTRTEEHDDKFLRRYGGGRGVGLYYLLQDLAARRKAGGRDPAAGDPLDGPLVLAAGLLTGTGFPGTPRFSIVARSPLTGLYGESEAGGYFGPELRRAGFEAVVLTGRAERPVYLFVHDGAAELRPADKLWGLTTKETQAAIREELGDSRVRAAMIGPAGERGARYAAVINELRHANGRTGMGAVFGARNLKAVAARGTGEVPVADPEAFKALSRDFRHELLGGVYGKYFGQHGTPSGVSVMNAMRALPTRNFRQASFPEAAAVSGETLTREHLIRRGACEGCPLACKRVVGTPDPPYPVDPAYGGPEYETIVAFGPLLGVGDLRPIFKANEICNAYGLDTISAGNAVAFALEAVAAGLVREADLGVEGQGFVWGNPGPILEVLGQIARQEGPAAFLGQGVRAAAERLGPEARRLAIQVKGLEVPMHDPRSKWALGLGYAVSPTGADHNQSPHDPMLAAKGGMLRTLNPLGILEPVPAGGLAPEKLRAFTYTHLTYSLYNCLPVCNMMVAPTTGLDLARLERVVQAVTGWNVSAWELVKIGERAETMARYYNWASGASAADDRLPERFFSPAEPPQPGGVTPPGAVDAAALEAARDLYYGFLGWDKDGRPLDAKLHELDLGWLVGV